MKMCSAAYLSYNVSVSDCGCIKLRGSIGGLLLDKCERLAFYTGGKKKGKGREREREKTRERMKRYRNGGEQRK